MNAFSHRWSWSRRVAAMTTALVVIAAGCSSGESITSPTTTKAPTTSVQDPVTADTLAPPTVVKDNETTVDAIDNDFSPKHLQISAGTKVTFENAGRNDHDVVPDDPGKADFGVGQDEFKPGEKTSYTFTKPGKYPYYCSLHATPTAGSMRGYITVTP